MNTNLKKGKVKGTVLFTIVAVMMVMIVFLMSTLAIASSAHKRSYYTYYQTQAQYAANAAIDAISNYAYDYQNGAVTAGNPEDYPFYHWISQWKNTDDVERLTIDVSFPSDANLHIANNVVPCYVDRVEDVYFWDKDSNSIQKKSAWKITAEATVGTGRNTAVAQVCNYIYDSYVSYENPDALANNTNWKRYEYAESDSGDTPPGSTSNINNALNQLGVASGNQNGADNMDCLGPCTLNIGKTPDAPYKQMGTSYPYNNVVNKISNDSKVVGNCIFVGNTAIAANTKEYIFQSAGEGMAVYGDFMFCNGNNSHTNGIYANFQKVDGISYNSIPYVYVDGKLQNISNTNFIGWDGDGQNWSPVNTFAGTIDIAENFEFYGDVFMYDTKGTSTLGDPSKSKTKLLNFTYNNLTKSNKGSVAYKGSSIYCANQTLNLTLNSEINVQDLVFANQNGTLNVSKPVHVYGSFVCAGALSCTGDGAIILHKADNTTETITSAEAATVKATNAAFLTNNMVDINAARKGLTGFYGPNVNLSYFPFIFRQDEICEKYYRWDLKEPATSDGGNKVLNAIASDQEIAESRAAGHTWTTDLEAMKITDADGKEYYVPFTTPKNTANIIVKELKIGGPNVTIGTKDQHGSYWNKADEFMKYMGKLGTVHNYTATTLKLGEPNAEKDVAPIGIKMPSKDVTFVSHDKNGKENSYTITGANYITHNCVIDISGDYKNSNVYYVDPTQDSNPLYITLKGNGGDAKVEFIVNNTQDADGKGGRIANRSEVYVMLAPDFKCNYFYLNTTGSYAMYKALDFDVISSPLYPGQSGYSATDKDAFKYELVPNVVVMGDKGQTYNFSQDAFFNAELVMPDCIVGRQTSNSQVKVAYREFKGSNPCNSNPNHVAFNVGTISCKQFEGQNVPVNVYVADLNRTPGKPTPEIKQQDQKGNKTNQPTKNNTKANFTNDHIGAN